MNFCQLQNPGIVDAGRDSEISKSSPLLTARSATAVCPGPCSVRFWISTKDGDYIISGQSVLVLPHPQSKKVIFLLFLLLCHLLRKWNFPCFSLYPFPFVHCGCTEKNLAPSLFPQITIVPFTQFHLPNTGDDFSVCCLYVLLIPEM